MNNFLDQKVWDSEHSLVWKEILSRWSQADYDDLTKRAERQATLKAEWTENEYARNRATAFPSIGDQLDMQYHDQLNGTTTWKDAIAKVKSDNPKE
jgi:hypothetical protein